MPTLLPSSCSSGAAAAKSSHYSLLRADQPVIANPEEAERLRLLAEREKRFYGREEDGRGWAAAGSPGDASPPRRARHDSPDASLPRRARHDSPDASPPRRARHDRWARAWDDKSRRKDAEHCCALQKGALATINQAAQLQRLNCRSMRCSPDASPPRRRPRDSPDASPPRRQRHDSPDASPPRRRRHDSPDASPPRRQRHDSPGDASPPRRRQRHDRHVGQQA